MTAGKSAPKASQPDRISEEFCVPDADVTFRSSDGVLFKFHRTYLEAHSEGFAVEGIPSIPDEIVELSEPSSTLKLLLQFMSPKPQPIMETMDFEALSALAEAAEKYRVYSAMQICMVFMKKAMESQNAIIVLNYAVKHDYRDLANTAALLAMGQPMKNVFAKLSLQCLVAWQEYYQKWMDVLREAITSMPIALGSQCPSCNEAQLSLLRKLGAHPHPLTNFQSLYAGYTDIHKNGESVEFRSKRGDWCRCSVLSQASLGLNAWKIKVEENTQKIPKFSTFLS